MTLLPKYQSHVLHVFAAMLLTAPYTAANAETACHYIEQASLPLSHSDQSTAPMVDGQINGKPVKILLGTANAKTYVLRAEADRQNLNPERIKRQTQGIGGLSSLFLVKVKDFGIGDAHVTNLRFPLLDELENSGAGGIVGVDYLMEYDVELDLANRRVKLFTADHCKEKALAYWDQKAMAVPMEFIGRSHVPRVEVKLNGTTLWALIDSGSSRTMIDLELARKLGFSIDAPGVTYAGKASGIGPEKRNLWNMTFDSFAIGDEVVEHPRMAVMDSPSHYLGRKPDMILGRDFLAAHHVLLAQSQMLFYYTYNGGPVFLKDEIDAIKLPRAAP